MRNVTADGLGAFEADFQGVLAPDGEPVDFGLAQGRVIIGATGGHAIVQPWGVLTMGSDMDTGSVAGIAGAGCDVEIVVMDPEGRVVATATSLAEYLTARNYVSGWNLGLWTANLRDALGQSVALAAGDTISVATANDSHTSVVPLLEADIDVQNRVLLGRTAPNAPIVAVYRSIEGTMRVPGLADGEGRFLLDATASRPLGWTVRVANIGAARASFHRMFHMPRLQVDLAAGAVSTEAPVGARGEIMLRRGMELIGSGRIGPRSQSAWLVGSSGEVVLPVAGDVVALDLEYPSATGPITFAVPALSLRYDPAEATIRGRYSPGWQCGYRRRHAYDWSDELSETGTVQVDPSGAYTVTYGSAAAFRPGSILLARLVSPDGHVATTHQTVPVVRVAHGTHGVHALGKRGDVLSLQLHREGNLVASVAGTLGRDGAFKCWFEDGEGQPVVAIEGDRVSGTIGTETVAFELGRLELDLFTVEPRTDDGPGSFPGLNLWVRVEIVAPTGRRVRIGPSARGNGADWADSWTQITPEDGRVGIECGFGVAAEQSLGTLQSLLGLGFEATVVSAEGHHYYSDFFPFPHLQVHLCTDRVTGSMSPGTQLRVSLERGGEVVAEEAVPADHGGVIDLRLRDSEGAPAVLGGGERLQVLLPEGVAPSLNGSSEIELQPLTVGLSPGNVLRVEAEPGRRVSLAIHLRDGRRVVADVTTDESGRFELAEAPARASWDLADVSRVVASIVLDNGHEVVANTDPTPAQTPAPTLMPTANLTATLTPTATPIPTLTPTPRDRLERDIYLPAAHRGGHPLASGSARIPSGVPAPTSAGS